MTQPLHVCMARNERLPCKAPGCTERRSRVGGYCINHGFKANRFGHPLHRKLMRQHYLGHVEEVQAIIDKNASHQAILIGLEYFETLLDQAGMDGLDKDLTSAGARGHLLRLYDYGVRPVDMLAECGALYLLHCREPNRIRDRRHLVTMLGHRLIRLAPMPKGLRPRGSLSRAIGGHIMKSIGVLLVNLQQACERSIEKDTELKRALARELEV